MTSQTIEYMKEGRKEGRNQPILSVRCTMVIHASISTSIRNYMITCYYKTSVVFSCSRRRLFPSKLFQQCTQAVIVVVVAFLASLRQGIATLTAGIHRHDTPLNLVLSRRIQQLLLNVGNCRIVLVLERRWDLFRRGILNNTRGSRKGLKLNRIGSWRCGQSRRSCCSSSTCGR